MIASRRRFLSQMLWGTGALMSPSMAWALGEKERFVLAQLKHSGARPTPRPSALRRLMLEVEKRTSVAINTKAVTVSASSKALFDHPFLVWSGDRAFSALSDKEVKRLRVYLQSGGFLFIDAADGLMNGPFMKSARRELARIWPGKTIAAVPKDHVVYKSFYLIREPVGRVAGSSTMEALFDDDRLPVVLSGNDVLGALERDSFGNWVYDISPGGQQQRELALRLGINLVMYALCINYKADQVHIPFILKRRKWRVD